MTIILFVHFYKYHKGRHAAVNVTPLANSVLTIEHIFEFWGDRDVKAAGILSISLNRNILETKRLKRPKTSKMKDIFIKILESLQKTLWTLLCATPRKFNHERYWLDMIRNIVHFFVVYIFKFIFKNIVMKIKKSHPLFNLNQKYFLMSIPPPLSMQ
jgi:hypothetical protein